MLKVSLPPLMLVIPPFPEGCRVVLSPVQNDVDDRPLMLARMAFAVVSICAMSTTAGGVAGILTFTEVAFGVGATAVVWFTLVGSTFMCTTGRVAGILTFTEVAFVVGATAVVCFTLVGSTFMCSTSRVAGILTFTQVAFVVGRTAVVGCTLKAVGSTLMCTAGRVAGILALIEMAFWVRTSWRATMFSSVGSALATTSGVAGLLSGDQGTRFTLEDGLRKREGDGRHQGE